MCTLWDVLPHEEPSASLEHPVSVAEKEEVGRVVFRHGFWSEVSALIPVSCSLAELFSWLEGWSMVISSYPVPESFVCYPGSTADGSQLWPRPLETQLKAASSHLPYFPKWETCLQVAGTQHRSKKWANLCPHTAHTRRDARWTHFLLSCLPLAIRCKEHKCTDLMCCVEQRGRKWM